MAKTEIAGATYAVVPAYFESARPAKFYLNEPGRDAVRAVARKAGIVMTLGVAGGRVPGPFGGGCYSSAKVIRGNAISNSVTASVISTNGNAPRKIVASVIVGSFMLALMT